MRSLYMPALMVLALIFAMGCSPQESVPATGPVTEPALPPGSEPVTPPSEDTSAAQGEAVAGKQVTIYRDTWGVPHIYADTDAAAAYGLGYAQAEDRIGDIYGNARIATGTAAEAFGQSHIRNDFGLQLVRNAEVAQKSYTDAPDYLRELVDNFVAGMNAYIERHPEKKPEWSLDFQPWHCSAIGRAMIMRWPLGTVADDLGNKKERTGAGASNEWAVSPQRSATGGAILLTDPHLSWDGMANFYEARVHGDKLHMNGFFLVGSPLLGFGHSNHIGWAPTTGGPDTSDVFEVKLDMSNFMKPKYEMDGQWHDVTVSEMKVLVKDGETRIQPRMETPLGPIFDVDRENMIGYIGASPYFDDANLFEQTYRMLLAKDADEFYEALSFCALMEQNIMFADTSGNIQYVRNGRVPKRSLDYDWNAPVPATAASVWTEIHPIADLVQIKNPESGYMQNCNISPLNMMKNSPMTPDKYIPYIYNVTWDRNNPRSKRAVELLDADASITKEEAIAITMNVYDILAKPWQEALAGAIEGAGADRMKDETFAKIVNNILAWNGEFLPESNATAVYKVWRMKCSDSVNVKAIAERATLTPEEKTALLDKLAEAIAEMTATYGSAETPWGEIYRVGRGDKYFPVGGADFGGSTDGLNMSETLFDVRCSEDRANPGKYIANNGSMATMIMFFSPEGVESLTCTPWGQSGDPASKHYVDQAEKLYSKRQMKPSWWTREEVLANHESEVTLVLP
ncbi:MAG: penicillin acylase family protein [Candidatus Hydrogenedentes bacterium]|nr:penicillin acylase family protein [Candidatus Hydrogenedentota bacterium]